jgi:hypothetical protein
VWNRVWTPGSWLRSTAWGTHQPRSTATPSAGGRRAGSTAEPGTSTPPSVTDRTGAGGPSARTSVRRRRDSYVAHPTRSETGSRSTAPTPAGLASCTPTCD